MSATILVTGASGFLGRALCPALTARGYVVRPAVRRHAPGIAAEVVVGEIGPDTDWATAMIDVDCVVHCAARVHVMNDTASDALEAFRKVNTAGTLNLARQAAAAGVKRFVFVSTIKVNGESTALGQAFRADDEPAPLDAYGQSKHEAEVGLCQLGRKTGMEVVIVRPPLVYGPGVKANFAAMARGLASGMPLPLGAVRDNRRSLVALDNLVDLIVTCIDHPAAANQVFLVSDGEDLSTTDLLGRMGRAMGRPARLLPIPATLLHWGACLLGKGEVARRLLGNLQVDITKTKELLGWTPPIGVDEGLRRTVQGLSK